MPWNAAVGGFRHSFIDKTELGIVMDKGILASP